MAIERLTEDELAAFVRDTETRVVRVRDHWWFEPKPFFFRPLLPLVEIRPAASHYPALAWFGGLQHCVPDDAPANSRKSYFVFDQPQKYDVAALSHGQANKIRKGLKLFQWRRITDLDHFIAQAYSVYVSFADRTRYQFRKERKHPRGFASWARALFAHPKVVINGAYHDNRLSAVSIYYLVDGVFVNGTYFSDTQSQALQVHDFVLHNLRTDAATTDAGCVFMGAVTHVEGIDRAKQIRGCQLITRRTHLQLNAAAAAGLKWFKPDIHAKLLGMSQADDSKGNAGATKALATAPKVNHTSLN